MAGNLIGLSREHTAPMVQSVTDEIAMAFIRYVTSSNSPGRRSVLIQVSAIPAEGDSGGRSYICVSAFLICSFAALVPAYFACTARSGKSAALRVILSVTPARDCPINQKNL